MVNCCAPAGIAARIPQAAMPAAASFFSVVFMETLLPTLVVVIWPADSGRRSAIDRLELQTEHRLGDEDVDAERWVKKPDREVDRHDDAEMHGIDADRLDH